MKTTSEIKWWMIGGDNDIIKPIACERCGGDRECPMPKTIKWSIKETI